MAEAHAAVAFQFVVTPEGVDVKLNHEAIKAIVMSGLRSWKKRYGRMKNQLLNGVYPASPATLFVTITVMMSLTIIGLDPSYGTVDHIQTMPFVKTFEPPVLNYISIVIFSTTLWLIMVFILRYALKALLSYTSWLYEPRGKMSLQTKVWFSALKLLCRPSALFFSFQGALPKLPLPSLPDTLERFLRSIEPLLSKTDYNEMQELAQTFETGVGRRLQKYLVLKSWWSTNYVSDWWEQFVYLRGRSPLMVNSNFYGVDIVNFLTDKQAARAAHTVYTCMQFRRLILREELEPVFANKTVPLCPNQYDRQFFTTRVPGVETDRLVKFREGKHVAVYHKGRFYKLYFHSGGRPLNAAELEISIQKILDDNSPPCPGEEILPAMTAGERVPWAQAREKYFARGVNKASLDTIESAGFFLALDETAQSWDGPDEWDKFGLSSLYGNCHNRWFDKSFNFMISSNGRNGCNVEHSWGDSPIMAHLVEFGTFCELADRPGYTEDGHCRGTPAIKPPESIRLKWDFPPECIEVMNQQLTVAQKLAADVELHLFPYKNYGKGFIKKCRAGPDGYTQMALQLANYMDLNRFSLTYESVMTRFYREGRTETARSCTAASCDFVRSMLDPDAPNARRVSLLRLAIERHQGQYRDAMTGRGIDRHLLCLYVVTKYLGEESPFLEKVIHEPWRLSTSQTPHIQTDLFKDLPGRLWVGGGFGPVADDGYGVSYLFAEEDTIFFHVSCKKSCPETNAHRFGQNIRKALAKMQDIFSDD